MRRRFILLLSTIAVGVCVSALFAQLYVDRRIRSLLRSIDHDAMSTSIGSTDLSGVSFGRVGANHFGVGRVSVTSSLIRRRCDGKLTWGVGARLELQEIEGTILVSSTQKADFGAAEGCFDAEWSPPLSDPELSLRQARPIRTTGFCGPELTDLMLRRASRGSISVRVGVSDRSHCLKKLSLLAPNYPEELIPETVRVRWESRDVKWSQRKLTGSSAVGALAELSRSLRDAELRLEVSWKSLSGHEVGACFRRNIESDHSSFEAALGIGAETLQALSRPFVSADNREVLSDLRSDEARCDGSSNGLFFTSDLSEVRLLGKKLERRRTLYLSAPGFRRTHCGDPDKTNCRYHLGVLQLTEKGRLARPEQLEAIVRTLEGQSDKGPLVVGFLHGWRHDASPHDGNLRGFEHMLRQLARRAAQDGGSRRPVFGIYLSWPGRLFDSPSANKLATFWNRLEVAQLLGDPSSDLGIVLERLARSARLPSGDAEETREAQVTWMGHSMGADPLLHAVSRLGGGESPDAVILVNPAVSVSRVAKFRSAGFPPETTLISYGSVADQVTQQFFPLGGAVEFSGDTREQLASETTTLNNSPRGPTRRLRGAPTQDGVELCLAEGLTQCVPGQAFEPPPGQLTIVSVADEIMGGHADFTTPAFIEHLVDLVLRRATAPRVDKRHPL